MKAPGPLAAAARQSAATTGRDGKGRIFVWSSGNGRLVGDDCNFDGYANSRFAIAVGASTDAAVQMSTSEGCSALMLLAPGGGGSRTLTTTDLVGTPGYDASDYTGAFGASSTGAMSAAAPTVSGAVALMLARNPNLTWRDVQHILRRTSVRILPTDPGWTTGPFPHNERLGFGLLDAEAAVDMAGTWVNVPAEEVLAPPTRNVNQAIPDINATGINDSITISGESNFVIEHVEVEFNATHTWRGDLQVKLTSPSGVVSNLAPIRPSDSGDNFTAWKFGSTRHWGQTAGGVWTLNVADRRFQDTGTWSNWTLKIYGYHTSTSAPGTFSKSSPASGASGIASSTTLSWAASSGATNYEYCYDTTNDNACVNWINAGTNTSAAVSGLSAGATYYWHVRSNNATGVTYSQGSATAFWSFSTGAPPGAFAFSAPANGAANQPLNPTLSWTASAGATGYEYCYDTTNNSACDTSWFPAGGTSFALSGLAPSTTYFWHVRALNASGALTYAGGSPTTFRAFTTLAAPGAFSHISPGNGATGQPLSLSLFWAASSAVTSYEYCYDTTNDGVCGVWTNVGANTSAALSGLAAGTTYYWQVRAVNGGGTTYAEGSSSSHWSFVTTPAPGAFGHSSPSNGATGQAMSPTLTWSAAAGAASYDYCYDTTNNNSCDTGWISVGAATSVGLSGLTGGTSYYWQVRAINAVGTTYAEANASAFWSFTTVALPGAFSHTSPSNGATSQSLNPTLSWGASSGATGYEYCYDTTNDNACSAWTSTGTNRTAALTGLAAGTTYYWQVRATNAGGTLYAEGAPTSFWSFTTIALPGAFAHSTPANNATGLSTNPTLNWTASTGATSYEYCVDTTNDNACANWTSTGATASASLSGLTIGTTYYWQVRATNAGGTTYADGAATSFWNFTTLGAPGAFNRTSPANGATSQALNPTLAWASSSTATGYEYCIDTTNDNACSGWTSTGTNTSIALSNLAAGTEYFWQVRSTNAAGTTYGTGGQTSFWSFTTLAAPGAFVHVSPANSATGQSLTPTLSWGTSAGAASYAYCIDTTNDNACSAWTSTGTNTSVGVSGLANGTTYYWHARATNASGTTYADGSATAFSNFTTQVAAPAAFGHNSPGNGATGLANNPTLSWSASNGAASFEYCIDTTNNNACDATWISTGTNTSVALSNLAFGTAHYWQVRAINPGGTTYAEGAATGYWTFTTQVAVPAAFTRTSPANGATGQALDPSLSWGASTGATSYEYCIDTTNDNACANWTSTGANTSVGLNGLAAGTTYFWQVRATNVAGTTYSTGGATSFWSLTTLPLPGAFSHSAPTNGATGQALNPTLSWGASTTAAGYEYCVDTTNDNACSGWTSTGTNTSVGLSGLAAGTTYFWHARATNAAGTTYAGASATTFSSFTTQVAAPAAFSHVSPANGAAGQPANPTLSWGASTGAASYEYCIDTTNNNACNATWISTGSTTSVGLTGLTAGTTYYWHARATNPGGTVYADGAATTFWSFTTQVAPPAAFGHNSPANGATGLANNPTLTWSASAGAASYEYCIDTTNDNACSTWTSTGTTASAALTNLTAGTAYFWQVRAINAGGTTYAEGAAASFWTFTTQVAAPAAFTHSSPANGATGQSKNPTLTWTASTGATSYQYCIDTTNDNACSAWTSNGTNTSVALSNLASGTAHYWHVRATNAGGTTYAEGSATTFWNFTTQVAAPAAFTKTSPANGATAQPVSLNLTWAASAGATGYEFCLDTTNDNACSGWTSTGTNTSTAISGLSQGTTYYWHVRASNPGGTTYAEGAATSFWSLTTLTAAPGAFVRSGPANGATKLSVNPTLSWTASTGAASYEYCIDTINNSACDVDWVSVGTNTSVGLSGLSAGTTYYWHVRAVNAGGTTYANGSATNFFSFTTKVPRRAMVDLDGDGSGDVFTYNPVNGAWARQLSQSGGGFEPTLGTWAAGWSTVAATFNDDDLTDLFVFNPSNGDWFKMINTGSGFTVQSSSAWWPGWQKFVLDLDADGISDLFLYDPSTGHWFKALSTPTGFDYFDGWWTPGWEITPMTLNGDDFGDLFLIDRTNGLWYWAAGEAGGGFSYPQVGYWAPDWDLYPGDFNGDGHGDFFLYRPDVGEHYVALNNGSGYTYVAGYGWAAGWTPMVADLNGDEVSDLFLYNKATGKWFELLGNGVGQFTTVGEGSWTAGWDLHPTDFNDDGRADLLLYKPATGEWFQAWNSSNGVFAYFGGQWQAGLNVVVRPPIR